MILDQFLGYFPDAKKTPKGYKARCPGHEDGTPSLYFENGEKGIVLHCFADCTLERILAPLGLEARDLFYDSVVAKPAPPRRANGSNGHVPSSGPWKETAIYVYETSQGDPVMRARRLDRDGEKRFVQEHPDAAGNWVSGSVPRDQRVLYRLPTLREAHLAAHVVIVEGEKCADRVAALGFDAVTTLPGGASAPWSQGYGYTFSGCNVVMICDADSPGRALAARLAKEIGPLAISYKVLDLYPALSNGDDIADWIERGGTREQLQALIEQAPLWAPQSIAPTPSVPSPKIHRLRDIPFADMSPGARILLANHKATLDAKQIAALPPAPSKYNPPAGIAGFVGLSEPADQTAAIWLIPGIIPRGVPMALAGSMKLGKTFIITDLAICLAAGISWLGVHPAIKAKVLFLALEDSPWETARRLWRICRGHGIKPTDLQGQLQVVAEGFRFDRNDDLAEMRRTLSESQPDLIIIDSLARTHRGDENSVKEMQAVTLNWKALSDESKATIICIHHYGKGLGGGSPGRQMRGTSDLWAMVRHIMGVTRVEGTDDTVQIECEGNLPGQAESFCLRRSDGGSPLEPTIELIHAGDPGDSKDAVAMDRILDLIRRCPGQYDTGTLRDELGIRKETLSYLCRKLEANGKLWRPSPRGFLYTEPQND